MSKSEENWFRKEYISSTVKALYKFFPRNVRKIYAELRVKISCSNASELQFIPETLLTRDKLLISGQTDPVQKN